MNKDNRIKYRGIILAALYGLCCIWVCFQAITAYVVYARHNCPVESKINALVVSKNNQVVGQLSYLYKNRQYEVSLPLTKTYPNHFAAQFSLASLEGSNPVLWINKKNPDEAVHQRSFPVKKIIYCILIQAIGCYFFLVKRKIEKKETLLQ